VKPNDSKGWATEFFFDEQIHEFQEKGGDKMLSWLALIFLTLAGYSAGAALTCQRIKREKTLLAPSLIDTMMVVILWIGGIVFRLSGSGPWRAVWVCLILAIVAGSIVSLAQPRPDEGKPLPQ
jgi:lipopolysaccharide export LptBFGC system permease protein LptF